MQDIIFLSVLLGKDHFGQGQLLSSHPQARSLFAEKIREGHAASLPFTID
jgi:hypothetical protein